MKKCQMHSDSFVVTQICLLDKIIKLINEDNSDMYLRLKSSCIKL